MTLFITPDQARTSGYLPLTTAYTLPVEESAMTRVLDDMRRSGIACVLVRVNSGVEVWRSKSGYRVSK